MGLKGWNVAGLIAIGSVWFCGTTQREKPVVGDASHHGRIGPLETKVAASPRDPAALRELAQAYLDVRQPGMAVGTIERAPSEVREEPTVEHLYARALLDQGRSADALAAEKRVLAANAPGFTALALRPRLVWGPRDGAVLPEVLEAVKKGAFAWIDQGRQRTSTTWVGNLAAAVELALTKGQGGEAYFIADEGTQSMREFLTSLASTQQVTLPSRSIPGALARPVASLVEKTWAVFAPKKKPPMVGFSVAMLSRSVTVKTEKARRELGYSPEVTVEQGLARMR